MQTRQILKNILDLKVLLSLLGGIAVSIGSPLIGNLLWIIGDSLWLHHFRKVKDNAGQTLMILWIIIATYGAIYWSIII